MARADDCSGPGHVQLVAAEEDRETLTALQALLPPSEDTAPAWVLTITGPRTVLQHRDGDRFARSLEASSTPYARASAAAELLTAARAAICPTGPPEALEAASSSSRSTVLAVGLGARIDADVDGPWLLRPTAFTELQIPIGGDFVLLIGLEAHVLGFHERSTPPPELTVRYLRHDAAASLGVGFRLGPLLLTARLLGGLSIRDVTASDETGALTNRLDAGPSVGGALGLRVPLVGPLGLRLIADLVGVPQTFTYRTLGTALVREQPIRIGGEVAVDLAW